MIWDLQERVPPDASPSEGGTSNGETSRHCGTSPHIGFYHRRLEAASTDPPRTKTSKPNLHFGTNRFVQSYIGCILSKVEGAGLDRNFSSVLVLPHRRDPLPGSKRRRSGRPRIAGTVIWVPFSALKRAKK